jgi:hypothetical protein
MRLLSISDVAGWERPGETTAWKLQAENSTARRTGFAIQRRADQVRFRITQPQQLRLEAISMHIAGFSVWVIEVFALAVGALVAESLVADAADALG